jgi:hypothetical protein
MKEGTSMKKNWVVGVVLAAAACGGLEGRSEPESSSTASALSTEVALISAATCQTQEGMLLNCVVATRSLQGLALESAVPLRTKFKVTKTAGCNALAKLEISLTAEGADPLKLAYLTQSEGVLRRRDGQAVPVVVLADSSSRFTGGASFAPSCRITLSMTSNEVDIDSRQQAQAVWDALQADLAAKRANRDRLQALTKYARAYLFMRSVADSFRRELTTDAVQGLRTSADDTIMAIATLLGGCGDTVLSDDDRANVMRLFAGIRALGDASAHQSADGGTKTLADYLGAEDQAVLATVERLAALAQTGDGGLQYDADYRAAQLEVSALEAKVTLAATQLAPWLGDVK